MLKNSIQTVDLKGKTKGHEKNREYLKISINIVLKYLCLYSNTFFLLNI